MPKQQAIDSKYYNKYMRIAISYAKRGVGFTSPNPAVGALIVKKNQIIGLGWHQKCGAPHAEIMAFQSLENPQMAKGADLYVTLEPCSTTGRTPPCCDAIIRYGIGRVIIGCIDPNPLHRGRGIQILEEHGISVISGICEKQCEELNPGFMKWIITKRPFVLLKMAETLDGKIATATGDSKWVTSATARKRVSDLRLLADAIIAGGDTWRLDHPQFTSRMPSGEIRKKCRLFAATHQKRIPERDEVKCVVLDSKEQWNAFLEQLGKENITMLLIEGGGKLASNALRCAVVDEIEFHIAPKILGGEKSRSSVSGWNPTCMTEAIPLKNMRVGHLGTDFFVRAYPDYSLTERSFQCSQD